MRIRTHSQLGLALAKALAWRKKELTRLKFAVDTAPDDEQRVLLRAAVTLLYAHWEGFVKFAATSYLQFVAFQKPTLEKAAPNIVAVALRAQIRACGAAASIPVHAALVESLTTGRERELKISWKGVIKTRSNLKSAVLEEIVATLALNFAPFELKAKPVIDRLVEARNGVAHGQGIAIAHDDYLLLHNEIIALLDEFRDQVEDAAVSARYRNSAA